MEIKLTHEEINQIVLEHLAAKGILKYHLKYNCTIECDLDLNKTVTGHPVIWNSCRLIIKPQK